MDENSINLFYRQLTKCELKHACLKDKKTHASSDDVAPKMSVCQPPYWIDDKCDESSKNPETRSGNIEAHNEDANVALNLAA